MAMEGTTLRKRVKDESGKRHEKSQKGVLQVQSMTMEKSWIMMIDRTDIDF